MVNGEEVGPEDVEFDAVEDPTSPPIDGVTDEANEPMEDPANYGMNYQNAAIIRLFIIFEACAYRFFGLVSLTSQWKVNG